MQVKRTGFRSWQAGLLVLALSLGTLHAAGPDLKVRLEGQVQIVEDGDPSWVAIDDGGLISTGERIRYRIMLSNAGTEAATETSVLGQIPDGTRFVLGTATLRPEIRVEYSIDGGETFSATPTIVVRGEDGKPRAVPAPADAYTTIRWAWNEVMNAGATSTVSYQVQVR